MRCRSSRSRPGHPARDRRSCCSSSGSTTRSTGRALPVATQEEIIGRRKLDSAELDPKPPASHVARTDQDRLGKIFRRNIAYGTLTRHGTIFVGFCADQRVLAAMLENMVGSGGPPDALMAVTRPLTGAYYVIPSVDALSAFGTEEPR